VSDIRRRTRPLTALIATATHYILGNGSRWTPPPELWVTQSYIIISKFIGCHIAQHEIETRWYYFRTGVKRHYFGALLWKGKRETMTLSLSHRNHSNAHEQQLNDEPHLFWTTTQTRVSSCSFNWSTVLQYCSL